MFDIGPKINDYLGVAAYFWVIILGVILGSFLNSWIWRRRENIRIIGRARSICIHCRRELSWHENIPLLSFLVQKSACRTCRQKIPFHYFLVEAITPVLLVIVFHHCLHYLHFSEWQLLRNILFLSILIIIFVYDWLYKEVIAELVWAGSILGFLINYFFLNKDVYDLLLGSAIVGGFFLAQYLISQGRWIGGGDVRLGFMFGLWFGWQVAILVMFLAYILGAIVGLTLILFKKAGRKTELPFGTFLSVAAFVCMLYSNEIVGWYLNLLK